MRASRALRMKAKILMNKILKIRLSRKASLSSKLKRMKKIAQLQRKKAKIRALLLMKVLKMIMMNLSPKIPRKKSSKRKRKSKVKRQVTQLKSRKKKSLKLKYDSPSMKFMTWSLLMMDMVIRSSSSPGATISCA